MEKRQRKKGYPTPFTIDPISAEHTHTFIVLHGRGSKGEKFGRELLDSANLPARLPTVRFVFPTASKRRSTIFKKMPINQWFDNYSLDDPSQRTDLQADGLMETAQFLRELIDAEAQILDDGSGQIGYQKVILGGLSQGCAAGIFTLLGGGFGESENERPGALFGMSGWLPFERQLNDMTNDEEEEEEEEEKTTRMTKRARLMIVKVAMRTKTREMITAQIVRLGLMFRSATPRVMQFHLI